MLLPALLAALAVAPASAAAVRPASCLHVSSGTAPSSLDALRDCQDRARAGAVASAESKGRPLTAAQLDSIDDYQRAEARKFLARSSASGGPTGKLGGLSDADAGRAGAASGAIQGLQGRLHAAAGDGRNGVTPAMADDIRATLTQTQGSVSPDMQALLDGVQRDGGKLTPGTMKLLQGAGKAAKGEGLDLGIDPAMEKELLQHDFDADKPAFDAQQPPGTN